MTQPTPGGNVNAANLNFAGLNTAQNVVGPDLLILSQPGKPNKKVAAAVVAALAGGGIGGTIAATQIAFGAATADEIEGIAGLTFDGTVLKFAVPDVLIESTVSEVTIKGPGSEDSFQSAPGSSGGGTLNNTLTSFGNSRIHTVGDRAVLSESWTYDDFNIITTTAPLLTKFKMNSLTPALVTEIAVNDSPKSFQDFGLFFGTQLAVGDRFTLKQTKDGSKFIVFQVSSALIDAGGFWRIPVTVIASGTIFDDEDQVSFYFSLVKTLPASGIANNAVQARRTTPFSLLAAFVDITLDTTDIETDAAVIEHDALTDRIVFKVAGTYEIAIEMDINNTLTTPNDLILVQARVRLNDAGTGINGSIANQSAFQDTSVGGGDGNFLPHFGNKFIATLAVNDFITLQLNQIPDGTLTVFTADNISLQVTRLL